jgi:3-phenylpropionate/cinnamic acid dioxygenase small subunit
MSSDTTQQLQERLKALIAKEEIRDVLYRYCRAVDRGDLELMKSCYHPDARDDHGFFSGLAWDFAEYVLPILAQLELSIHSISNSLIELSGSKAHVETHWSVIHRLKRSGKFTDLWHQGRYLDEFELRDGNWKILSRVCVVDAERSINTVNFLNFIPNSNPHKVYMGHRGESDPVYKLHAISSLIRPQFALAELWAGYRSLLRLPKFIVHYLGFWIQSYKR